MARLLASQDHATMRCVIELNVRNCPHYLSLKSSSALMFLAALGGKEDGFIQCRYCRGFFTFKDVAMDHERPLSRGGSQGLENIGYPCRTCNQAKGSMDPGEFLKLREFLEKEIPMARQDVLSRLSMSVQLAAGARGDAAVKGELKKQDNGKRYRLLVGRR